MKFTLKIEGMDKELVQNLYLFCKQDLSCRITRAEFDRKTEYMIPELWDLGNYHWDYLEIA